MIDSAFAQTNTAATPAPAEYASPYNLSGIGVMLVISVLFYFILIRPQGSERKKREEMLNNIQRGDRVLTRGGLYGTVADIKEQILILKISENSKIEVDRSYIDSVQKPGQST